MEQYYLDYIYYIKNAIELNPDFAEQYYVELAYWANFHVNYFVQTTEISNQPRTVASIPYRHPINVQPNTEDELKVDDIKTSIVVKPKTKIVIEDPIHTLRDLLDILEKYPYYPDIESNIDLLSLNSIRDELAEIDAMIGLKTFKETLLDQLMYFMQDLHMNHEPDFKHMVIYGPPGTGKTQIASLVGKMYSKMGILKNGIFKKVTRTDLVAGYLGQTSIKTAKVIQDSLGGCLFIDEVYSLGTGGNVYTENGGGESGGDSFSKECIDTLCEALSNHKEDLMVIIAGYEKDINESFFKMNQGLPSRFIWRFHIDEYTHDELMQIFIQKVKHNGWFINEDQDHSLQQWFVTNHKHFPYFGRDMELLFTYTKIAHGRRIFGKPPELRKHLIREDLDNGLKIYMKNTNNDKETGHKLSESCLGMYM
jgi:SpoVK/Ycf46/Vps4 family AAA+-type ATPase